MDIQGVAALIGTARFAGACDWAWRTAAGTGHLDHPHAEWPDDLGMVPHDAVDAVWVEGASRLECVTLALALYRRMPCYGNLMYVSDAYADWATDDPARPFFWREYRELLSSADDRLADPICYSLWCDYFERDDRAEEAWVETAIHPMLSERGLERVLEHSGPVPYRLKSDLYAKLVSAPRWHPFLFKSLLSSRFDAYGDIDQEAARTLLDMLGLPSETEHLETLRAELGWR